MNTGNQFIYIHLPNGINFSMFMFQVSRVLLAIPIHPSTSFFLDRNTPGLLSFQACLYFQTDLRLLSEVICGHDLLLFFFVLRNGNCVTICSSKSLCEGQRTWAVLVLLVIPSTLRANSSRAASWEQICPPQRCPGMIGIYLQEMGPLTFGSYSFRNVCFLL